MAKFYATQRVISPFGEGMVLMIEKGDYPVLVRYDNACLDYFTADGKQCKLDKHPVLFDINESPWEIET